MTATRHRFISRHDAHRLAGPLHIERIPASGGASDEKIAAAIEKCRRERARPGRACETPKPKPTRRGGQNEKGKTMMTCEYCGEELDFLDTVTARSNGALFCKLYICHNESCDQYGQIYHIRNGHFGTGDPSGNY